MLGTEYYLIIDTQMGISRFYVYGPSAPDMNTLPSDTTCSYIRKEYKNTKVNNAIREFLNNPKFGITQAEVIDREEALKNCRSIIEYMKQFNLF